MPISGAFQCPRIYMCKEQDVRPPTQGPFQFTLHWYDRQDVHDPPSMTRCQFRPRQDQLVNFLLLLITV